jgi:mevalonate kinase
LHTQFQQKRIIEAKKFYLDQEQQTSTIVEKLKKDYERHFQSILKLYERGSGPLIKEYVEFHKLHKDTVPLLGQTNLRDDLEKLDELLYAFLINKRKLATLMGISITVSSNITWNSPSTLQQIRYLSIIIDDLIFLLYESPNSFKKDISFNVISTEKEKRFEISTLLVLDEKQNKHSKLVDALIQFKHNDAQVEFELNPIRLSICYA